MKKIFIGTLCLLLLIACKEEQVYFFDENNILHQEDVSNLFVEASNYIGQSIELNGLIFAPPELKHTSTLYKVFTDPLNTTDVVYLVIDGNNHEYVNGDYISFNGVVKSVFEGSDPFGYNLVAPVISAHSITMSTYEDVVSPTIKEVRPNITQEIEGIVLSLDLIQFADNETRFHFTYHNSRDKSISLGYIIPEITVNGERRRSPDNFLIHTGILYKNNEMKSDESLSYIDYVVGIDLNQHLDIDIIISQYVENYNLDSKLNFNLKLFIE